MKYLFEVSWEVCNLVGGIHTVLRSKAPEAISEFGDGYYLLGPLIGSNADFVETDEPDFKPIRKALEERSIRCKLGRWEIDGRPRVILVDFEGRHDPEKLLFTYWQQFGVDSLAGGWDYSEPVMFSTTCGEVIEAVFEALGTEQDEVVAHFHEWMSGGGLLYLKKNVPEIGTIFTTHATILGRSMAGTGVNIYSDDHVVKPDEDAKRYGVPAKHSMEDVCAREADIFTTVSQVTADEAHVILGTRPHMAVFNGVDAKGLPTHKEQRAAAIETKQKLFELAGNFLGRKLPKNTKMFMSSGRYEFHNKGYDVFLESLAKLEERIRNDETAPMVVAWFLVAAGREPVREEMLGSESVATHRLHDEASDPIVRACEHLGLSNGPDNKVFVIFTSAYLDGDDGFINMPYNEVLPAFDLGVFPSFYEPWGYTPLESIAAGVPTITTDLAGFGRWSADQPDHNRAVTIINRAGFDDASVVEHLTDDLEKFGRLSSVDMKKIQKQARCLAATADWSAFFAGYREAYKRAAHMADTRVNSLDTSSFSDELFISYKGSQGPGPHYRAFTVVPTLPEQLEGLRELAYNLWWVWHPEAQELFEEISPEQWKKSQQSPVRLLGSIPSSVLEEKATDKLFIKRYERLMEQFSQYIGTKLQPSDGIMDASKPVAYFSMEFGIHECLPTYSGGLGVLSGDHVKAASDLNIPFIGVGLFYKQGYFTQRIDRQGYQIEKYPFMDTSQTPARILRLDGDKEARIQVELQGKSVFVRIWQVDVGRVKLYLLDTDVDENIGKDRQITWQLYGGDKRNRIEQEIVLGIGGVKLVEDILGLKPSVYHLNEGHCGFGLFERIRRLVEKGLSFNQAREAVKASSVFTTHTPVPAGNETFNISLMQQYFSAWAPKLSISFDQLIEMGLASSGDAGEQFSMTVLALKLSSCANAVSKLHGKVCREMWRNVWKGVAVEEVPIGSITNGIHLTSWIGPNMRRLFGQYLDVDWDANHDDSDAWLKVDDIPDEMLWFEHMAQKKRLIETIKAKTFDDYISRGEDPGLLRDTIDTLSPDALTIGFARRFATYKRALLLLQDREAIKRLVGDMERPVQFIFAGKAHPADTQGKELIRELIELSRTTGLRGRIVYLENYDIALGRLMTQGVDVWLNTPIRPHEASGTSGMKVVPNGGLNCSILDGWWDEAHKPGQGWAINSRAHHVSREHQNEMDNNALMTLLEQEIVPCFYDMDEKGVPAAWVAIMKNAIKSMAPVFTTMRMVRQYNESMYLPTAKRAQQLCKRDYAKIKTLTNWKRNLGARFSTVQIDRVNVRGMDGSILPSNSTLDVEMYVTPGKLDVSELCAQLIIGPGDAEGFLAEPEIVTFSQIQDVENSKQLRFSMSHEMTASGSMRYAVRVVPIHSLLLATQDTGLVCWG